MKISDIIPGFKVYVARVKVKNPGYTTVAEVSIFAQNPVAARALLLQQYGAGSVVNTVREL